MTAVNTEISQFYIPESRLTYIQKVQSCMLQGKIAVLEGATGVGKTVLLEEILTQTLPDANKCYLTPVQGMTDIQIRSRLTEQLFGNVLFDPELPLLNSFIEFSQSQQLLICIDNCQFLSGRIIGELLQLFSEAKNLQIDMSICFALDKSLNSTLLNVNSSFVQICTVPMLNKQESYQLLAQYIDDLPAQANAKVKRWIENAAGLPIQLLAYSDAKAEEVIDNTPLNIKLWGSLLVLASLVLALGLYVYNKGNNSSETLPEPITAQLPEQGDSQVVKDWQSTKQAQPLAPPETGDEQEPNAVQEFEVDEKPMAQVIAEPIASNQTILADIMGQLPKTLDSEKRDTQPSITSKEVEKNPTTDLILSELTDKPLENKTKLSEEQRLQAEVEMLAALSQEQSSSIPNTKAPDEVASSDEISLDFFLSEQDTNDTEKTLPSDYATEPSTEPSKADTLLPELEVFPEDNNDSGIVATASESLEQQDNALPYQIDNELFMSLPRERFVLQLTAVSSEEVLSEYLASAPVAVEEMRIYQIQRNQKDWIVVTYGLFESIEQARLSAKKVEPNAWAKSISVIQQQILAFHKAQEQE